MKFNYAQLEASQGMIRDIAFALKLYRGELSIGPVKLGYGFTATNKGDDQ